jgi:hypothetical protein
MAVIVVDAPPRSTIAPFRRGRRPGGVRIKAVINLNSPSEHDPFGGICLAEAEEPRIVEKG